VQDGWQELDASSRRSRVMARSWRGLCPAMDCSGLMTMMMMMMLIFYFYFHYVIVDCYICMLKCTIEMMLLTSVFRTGALW
jgi:hypothetical protein